MGMALVVWESDELSNNNDNTKIIQKQCLWPPLGTFEQARLSWKGGNAYIWA